MSQRLNIRAFRPYIGGFAWPTVALAVATWASFLFAAWMLQANVIPPAVMVAVAVVCNYASFTVFHEAAHENIEGRSRGGLLTNVLGWTSGALFMAPFSAVKRIHLTHHQHTNNPERDPDHWVAGSNPLVVALRCLTIYPNYLLWYLFKLERPTRELYINVSVLLSFWGGCVALCFTPLANVAIYGFMVPVFLGTGVMSFLFDWVPHYPHQDRTPFGNSRYFPGALLNLIMLGQNVHGVHHLNPRIPFYRYQKAYFAALKGPDKSSAGANTDEAETTGAA